MEELDKQLLNDLQLIGYRYHLYHGMGNFALLVPLNEEIDNGHDSYTISIYDEQAYEMAGGVFNFSFYVLLQVNNRKI
jgi:hypothetical protein